MIRTLLVVTLLIGAYAIASYNPIVDQVKNGSTVLVCNDKVVPKERIVDFMDDTWIFDNGYAKNCEVK